MTPTPLDAKPQGAQFKLLNWAESFKEQTFFDGTGYRMNFTLLISDLAEAAERIEKLEREKQLHAGDTLSLSNELDEWKERAQDAEHAKDEIEQQAIAAGIAWAYERDALKGERDTALRALAEARRDAERYATVRAKFYDEILDYVYHYDGSERSPAALDAVIDAARQPEKDANNG